MKTLGLCLWLASAAVVLAIHDSDPECMWHDFLRHDNINAWEFQGQPHRHQIRDRDKAIHKMESVLKQLTDDPDSGVQFVPESRWMAIFKETSFMVSTRHGHPIHEDPAKPKEQPFPWKKLGYLRLRNYKLLTPAGAYVPSAMPGMADVTFKMKMVDPDVGPGDVQLPKMVGAAHLTAKIEEDIHCDHSRPSMSPLYRPVSQLLNISKIANVKDYFPNLAQVARLDENEVLPFMHEVYRAKIMWTVVFNGVIGEANLVIKYNTSFEDAVAGIQPKNGEMTLRIRRDVAEATGTTGEEGKKLLWGALDKLADAMQVFRDHGWDGKTPALPHKSRKPGDKHEQPSDKHHHYSHRYYEDPYYNEYEGNKVDCYEGDEGCTHNRELDYEDDHDVAGDAAAEHETEQETAAAAITGKAAMPRPLLTSAVPAGNRPSYVGGHKVPAAGATGASTSASDDTVSLNNVAHARESSARQRAELRRGLGNQLAWLKKWWQQPALHEHQ